MDGYDEVRVQVDRRGHVLGLVVIHDVGGTMERIRPLDVGPFDTLAEAVAATEPWLTRQQTLW